MKAASLAVLLLLAGIPLQASGNQERDLVSYVDLERFSGDWYVIALIPTVFEKNIANGVENYRMDDKGNIRVEYTFRKGGPEGKEKMMTQKGWVYDKESQAEWRVRPLWPFKLPYYVLELAEDYSHCVIGTNSKNYLWIMAREPEMEDEVLNGLIENLVNRGYDREKIIMMPQVYS